MCQVSTLTDEIAQATENKNMNNQSSESFIKYESADIYFIFSFVLDLIQPYQKLVKHLKEISKTLPKDEKWKQGLPPDRRGKPPMLVINRRESDKPDGEYISAGVYKKIVSESVTLKYEEIPTPPEKDLVSEEEKYEPLKPFKVDMEAFIRIADNGAGCITFKISISEEEKVTLRKIYYILSLSQRHYEWEQGISRLAFGNNSKFVKKDPAIFDKYSKFENDHRLLLFEIFVEGLERIEQEINPPNAQTDDDKFIRIQDKELMDFYDKKLVAQNPYILSVIELKGAEDGGLFWQDLSQKEMTRNDYKELSAILFRMVYPDRDLQKDLKGIIRNIRIPYELRGLDRGVLKNYAWDSRILMCFSRVSSLFACRNKRKSPAHFIRKSLLESLEILRTRWHMSILINALLDQDMAAIKEKTSSDNIEALKRLIQRRKQFAYFLEDPLIYNFEGSSITQIVAEAEEEMWLSRLRDLTFKKLEILDKLYQDQMQYIQITEFNKFEQKVEELRGKVL